MSARRDYGVPEHSWAFPDLRGETPGGPPTEKRCARCDEWKPLDAFRPNRQNRTGLNSYRRVCARAATQDWRRRNREQIKAQRRREYREAHPLPTRSCSVCSQPFTGRPDRIVCGDECRERRKNEQRRRARAA
jgi:hypothetical protein